MLLTWRKLRPTTTRGYIFTALTTVALVIIVQMLLRGSTPIEESTTKIPTVTLTSVSELANTALFSTVGTVEAISEVQLKAESGGQVIAVNTDLGKYVNAGFVIAQLESSRERAALLQAQGAYEATLAAAAQSELGVSEAKTALTTVRQNAVTTYASSYNTVAGLVKTDIDQFFANPNSPLPGLRINGYGQTSFVNQERVALQGILRNWQTASTALTPAADLEKALIEAKQASNRVLTLLDTFLTIIPQQKENSSVEEAANRALIANLTATRATLLTTISGLDNAASAIKNANDALARAELAASTPNTPSASSAQVKQALGALRAAQAAYEKTLVRTPISGVVNTLTIKRGDYVTPLSDVALVANNKGLQSTTAINETDRERLAVGDTVSINSVATGTITAIAGAVDPKTGKVAVKVSLPENAAFSNGSSVTLSFGGSGVTTATSSAELFVPLSAVKLGADGAVMFTLDNENKLVPNTVELGMVNGDRVLIKTGITAATKFIADARGLKAGETVTVNTN